MTWALKHLRLHNPRNPFVPTPQDLNELCKKTRGEWGRALCEYGSTGKWQPPKSSGEGSPAPFKAGCYIEPDACTLLLREWSILWNHQKDSGLKILYCSDSHFESIPHAAFDEGQRERLVLARAARREADAREMRRGRAGTVFGSRDSSFVGGAYGRQDPDGLAGIAVPLAGKGQVHGVINIIWAKAARSAHLADLQRAVEEIEAHFATDCGSVA